MLMGTIIGRFEKVASKHIEENLSKAILHNAQPRWRKHIQPRQGNCQSRDNCLPTRSCRTEFWVVLKMLRRG